MARARAPAFARLRLAARRPAPSASLPDRSFYKMGRASRDRAAEPLPGIGTAIAVSAQGDPAAIPRSRRHAARRDELQRRAPRPRSGRAAALRGRRRRAARARAGRENRESIMKFEIPPLPYPKNALAPFIGAETVDLHYEKHHRGYLDKLEKLVRGKPEADLSLEDLIRRARGEMFNNAAQVWNHDFYWLSMKPGGGGEPAGELAARVEQSLGWYIEFTAKFAEPAIGEFGSGSACLVQGAICNHVVCSSDDAENPLQRDLVPLLTLDVWEHAYYLDYRNERARYVEMFLDHLLDWDFVATNLTLAPPADEGLDIRGEGNPEADERYRERATRFARSGRVKPAAGRAARETPR